MAMDTDKRLTTLRALGEAQVDRAAGEPERTERILAAVRADAPGRDPKPRRLPRKWFRRRATPLDWALNTVIVVCFAAGLFLVLKTPYEYYMRSRTADKLRDAFLSGEMIEVGADAWAIPGEDTETPVIRETRPRPTTPLPTAPGASEPEPTEPEHVEEYKPPTVVIEPIGMIAIPRIAKEGDAVLEGATDVTLRYGIGRYEPSAPIGADGRTVLLGHKMKYYGVYFSRLQEMQVGDAFTITTRDTVYTYRVFQVESVYKDLLMGKIFAPATGKQCMLVTCDFRVDPQGNDRLLVHAELESAQPR